MHHRLQNEIKQFRRRALEAVAPAGPGAWLFQRQNLAWLLSHEPRKLPWQLALFRYYCGAQQRLRPTDAVLGGPWAYRQLARASHALGLDKMTLDIDDYRIYVSPSDPRALHIPNELAETDSTGRAIESLLSPGDSFIDIGANHGSFSVRATRTVGHNGYICAFEPQPELAKLVARSLEANAHCEFDVFSVALGSERTVRDFFVPRDSSGSAGVHQEFSAEGHFETMRIEQVPLDELINPQHLRGKTLIKIDVEGHELEVLAGARRLLESSRPTMIIEVNARAMTGAGKTADSFRTALREHGFTRVAELDSLDRTIDITALDTTRQRNIVLFM